MKFVLGEENVFEMREVDMIFQRFRLDVIPARNRHPGDKVLALESHLFVGNQFFFDRSGNLIDMLIDVLDR